ncbi:hypothetical protein FJZ31_00330 [Candidatus Poribacteria bacterium]|nr:hypothetical protein [Candidatus Poribacteria bacterium]
MFDTVKNNCFDAYVEFTYHVNPQMTREVIEMAGHGLSKEKLAFIANDIGPKLLPFIPKEELLKQLTIEDLRKRLKELENPEKLLKPGMPADAVLKF